MDFQDKMLNLLLENVSEEDLEKLLKKKRAASKPKEMTKEEILRAKIRTQLFKKLYPPI